MPAGRFLVIDQRTTFYEEGNRKEDHVFTEMKGFEASAPAWSSGYTSTKVVAGGEAGDGGVGACM